MKTKHLPVYGLLALWAFTLSSPVRAEDGKIEIIDAMIPYTITQPGSYVVAQDLRVVGGSNGITIDASNVTLDLNGHTIRQVAVGPSHGIMQVLGHKNVTVKNGFLAGFNSPGGYGISAKGGNNLIQHIQISECHNGIEAGKNSVIESCQITRGSGTGQAFGIYGGFGSRIENCTVYSNQTTGIFIGIYADSGSSTEGCVVTENRSTGNHCFGIATGEGSTVRGCLVRQNRADKEMYGLWAGSGSTIRHCVSYDNDSTGTLSADGFFLADNSVIDGCAVSDINSNTLPAYGVRINNHGRVTRVASYKQFSASFGFGFTANKHVQFEYVTALGNDYGAESTRYCRYAHSIFSNNAHDGVRVGESEYVERCIADNNDGVGLYADLHDNTFNNNYLADNGTGILPDNDPISSATSTRNSGTGNIDTFDQSNSDAQYGEIIDASAATTNFSASAWANFDL